MSTMVCPECGGATRAHVSRRAPRNAVRRHRVCLACEHCFTTYERVAKEEIEQAAGKAMLSVSEVAQRLGISRASAYYFVRVQQIPAMKLGTRYWVDPDWVEQHRAEFKGGLHLEPIAS